MIDFSGVDAKEKEKIDNGWRVYFEVGANQKFTLTATESNLDRQTTILRNQFDWISRNIIDIESPLAEDPQIQKCVEIQGKIDECEREHDAARTRTGELNQQVDRVRANLESAKSVASGGKIDKWIDDLDDSETEIRKINKETLPALAKKISGFSKELSAALQKVTANWKEK